MNDDPSNQLPPPEHHKTKKSWIIGGAGLCLIGFALIPTIFLTSIGIALMVAGACLVSFGVAGDRIKE